MTSTWNNPERTEILLTKSTGDSLILKEQMCIRYEGRELGVRIVNIPKYETGPIGFTYLPWRGDRWANFSFSIIKGDVRRLICCPTGVENQVWGHHINWDTVEIIENPESTLQPNLSPVTPIPARPHPL
jgi:hypothetical protein